MDPLLPTEHVGLLTDWDVSQFREMCHVHPSAEQVRWWSAVMNPGIDPVDGALAWGTSDRQWLREEQTDAAPYMALIQGAQARQKYLPQGVLMDGDLIITSMPDELPLSQHDWVCPVGKPAQPGSGVPGRTFVYKDLFKRAAKTVALTGTVSSSGAVVTGVNTLFLTELRVGDVIRSISQARRVTGITSNTSLTVDAAPSPAWSGSVAQRGIERFVHWPAAAIEDVRSASGSYPSYAYEISADGQELRWIDPTNAPAPDTTYSVAWRYYPIYQVLGDAGMMRRQVQGVGLPQRVLARLLTQITHTS